MAREMNKNCDLFISIPDYVDENIRDKAVMIIQSYTSIVNTIVWRKERWVIKYFLLQYKLVNILNNQLGC